MIASVKITVHAPVNNRFVRAEFHGPRATRKTAMLEMDGTALKMAGIPNNGRRLIPIDPLWWIAFVGSPGCPAPESIEIECIPASAELRLGRS